MRAKSSPSFAGLRKASVGREGHEEAEERGQHGTSGPQREWQVPPVTAQSPKPAPVLPVHPHPTGVPKRKRPEHESLCPVSFVEALSQGD